MQETAYLVFMTFLQLLVSLSMTFYFSLKSLVVSLVPRSYRRKDVNGKIALITGGGSGLGRQTALGLARSGAKIISWDVNAAGNEETARLIQKENGTCLTYTVDLCDRHAIYKAADKVKKEVGKVDILVNNAGIVTGKNLLDSSDEQIQRTFDVNALCHFWTVKAFLPAMMEANSGQIVTVASLAGFFGMNRLIDYCASKHAAVGFDESLRLELESSGYTGIGTTVICPYYINTGMFEGVKTTLIPMLNTEEVGAEITDAILMRSKILILPGMFNLFVMIKGLMPLESYYLSQSALGNTQSMDNFEGRKKKN